jgi:DNA-binding beta-propeller fold protein YncE
MNRFTSLIRLLMVGLIAVAALGLPRGALRAQDASPVNFTEMSAATLPWDAAPSPDASAIYFTAISPSGIPAVFQVSTQGGEAVELASGGALVMPFGVAVGTDGANVYVTDPWSAGAAGNGIFSIGTQSGEAALVAGTSGYMPQGLEIINQDGADMIYFSGYDPEDGLPAVFQIPAAGAAVPALLAKGAPLAAPSGVAISSDGTVYVLDRLAGGGKLGGVVRISGGSAEVIVDDVRTGGQLAGLTLTLDESLLLVSSLNNERGTAQVIVVETATLNTSIVDSVISANTGAGGLHRAANVNEFAWADSTGNPPGGVQGGTVYRVTFR